jgi:hypothetical protein
MSLFGGRFGLVADWRGVRRPRTNVQYRLAGLIPTSDEQSLPLEPAFPGRFVRADDQLVRITHKRNSEQ